MTEKEKREALIALVKFIPEDKLDEAGAVLGELMQRDYRAKLKAIENTLLDKHWHKLGDDIYTKFVEDAMANR